MVARQVQAYKLSDGSCPFRDWRRAITDKLYYRCPIDRVSEGMTGDCKPVGEGVHEMRIHHGPGYRVYFAYDGHTVLLLLVGGDKSTQVKDIEKAKMYWDDYQIRGGRK